MNLTREFKFACPVCHQHIQCAATSAGEVMACPTCYQKLVVPNAPSGNTTRLIIRAKQAPKTAPVKPQAETARPALSRKSLFGLATVLVLVAGVGILLVSHFAQAENSGTLKASPPITATTPKL
ncbi:MAG TPA: hypothetical protein VL527_11125 [Dongiaceae bacterium]|nr:hypothetical protein [Dongiaceae bacterium]